MQTAQNFSFKCHRKEKKDNYNKTTSEVYAVRSSPLLLMRPSELRR